MNWSDLRILLQLARHGTLRGAADSLGVNQSTVSRRLRALEEDLGTSMVETVGGRLVLTPAGERAAEAAKGMEAEADALLRHVLGEDDSLEGPVRLGVWDSFAAFHMDVLDSFRQAQPAITVELAENNAVESIARRDIDIAVRATNQPEKTLVGRKALRMEYAVFAHETLCQAHGQDWRSMPWVGWDPRINARMTHAWMQQHLDAGQVCLRVTTLVSMFHATWAGLGASIIPVPYANARGDLVRLSDDIDNFGLDIWVLTHRDLKRTARVQVLMTHLGERLSDFGKVNSH